MSTEAAVVSVGSAVVAVTCVSEAVVCSVGFLPMELLPSSSRSLPERVELSVQPAAESARDAVSNKAMILVLFDIVSLLLTVDNIQCDPQTKSYGRTYDA